VGGDRFMADARRSCGPMLECLQSKEKQKKEIKYKQGGEGE
jgi:hypothetical protein